MNQDLFQKLLILRTQGIGAIKYSQLINQFGSAAAAAESLQCDNALTDSVKREIDLADQSGIRYICDDNPLYPANLRKIKNHPPIITLRGNLSALAMPAVAIVGTRHATGAGMRFISELAQAFAARGIAVVSGMAMGTDTAAHTGALRSGTTIAVLAGGADYIWPLENESLYHKIIEQGAIISEMPVGTKPVQGNFIQRNRWIAGLCDKLILGEADAKSGSMATAGFALDYGRPVFAIPSHPSDSRSVGPNSLIASGAAKIVCGIGDFFPQQAPTQDFQRRQSRREIYPAPTSGGRCVHRAENNENALLDKLGIIPQSESVLAERVQKTIPEIKSQLVILELQGLARKTDSGYVKN
ncbi:MAG: DNA-processing protein DprA [Rickettsiales bacterium]|nr:DNA-processing protein DprA [Rickettsiales bacterium]